MTDKNKTVTQCIDTFLRQCIDLHNRDHIERYLALGGAAAMETQVNVIKGTPVEDTKRFFDDGYEYGNIRIPNDAKGNATFYDFAMRWPLERFADCIGSTGWCWRAKTSHWVGFDFDHTSTHKNGHGTEAIDRVIEACKALEYVEVRRSTGGSGLHLYVYFPGIPTNNHTEHAVLARRVLVMLEQATGETIFSELLDCAGGNFWIWGRKAEGNASAYELVKPAGREVTLDELPEVEIDTADPRLVEHAPMLDKHLSIVEALQKVAPLSTHVTNTGMIQCHTYALKMVHEQLGLRGKWETVSAGRNLGQANAFMFPSRDIDGAFDVYRYHNAAEAATWHKTARGFVTARFNAPPSLDEMQELLGGVPDSAGYNQYSLEDMRYIVTNLGIADPFEGVVGEQIATVGIKSQGGTLVIRTRDVGGIDPKAMKADKWLLDRGHWQKSLGRDVSTKPIEDTQVALGLDNYLRQYQMLDAFGATKHTQYRVKTSEGWEVTSNTSVVDASLLHFGLAQSKTDCARLRGEAHYNHWGIVCKPFQPVSGRVLNVSKAQLRCEPADTDGAFEHWLMVLNHLGQGLDKAVAGNEWCSEAGIRTGCDYLAAWIYSVWKRPLMPLPMLVFYGRQETGKSMFHESIGTALFTRGAVVEVGLTFKSEFNAMMEGVVICAIDEAQLDTTLTNKIKTCVNSEHLVIHKKGVDAYTVDNTTHWVTTTNNAGTVPIPKDDTRVVVITTPTLTDEQKKAYPKPAMHDAMSSEAACFLRWLEQRDFPAFSGRLGLPPLDTETKREWASSQDIHSTYISEHVVAEQNATLHGSDIYNAYCKWLATGGGSDPTTRQKFYNALRDTFAGQVTSRHGERGVVFHGVRSI